ncbi:phosphoglucosamine mutase, partial [Pseudomonas syringae pv. tagetis]
SCLGTKLADEIEMLIEFLLDGPMTLAESDNLGKVSRINDADGRYIDFCKISVQPCTDFDDMKVEIESARGATKKDA